MLHVELVSPEAILFRGEAEMVVCRTTEGQIAFLPGHTPLISQLQTGVLTYVQEGKSSSLHVSGGFVEVRDDHVSVLAEVAERPDEIDAARAKLSRDKLEKQLNAWSGTEEDFEVAKAKLDRSIVRLQLASSAR